MTTTAPEQTTSVSTTFIQPQTKKLSRLISIDVMRGFAMFLMLLAHSSWAVQGLSYRAHYTWERGTPLNVDTISWWIGLITSLATPTFFLMAGFGIALFEASRKRREWSQRTITQFLLTRGAVLIILDLTILAFRPFALPELDWHPHRGFVLLSIGLCLWSIAFLRLLDWRQLAVLALVLTLGTQLIYFTTTIPANENLVRSILLYPSPVDSVGIGFPVLAWLPVMLLGYLTARSMIRNPEQFGHIALIISGILGLTWLLVVTNNNFGRLYYEHPLIGTRRPPSLDFLTLYLSLAYLVLYLFHMAKRLHTSFIMRGLALLGQTALFFYAIHIAVVTVLVGPIVRRLPLSLDEILLSLLVTTLSLVIMFPLCMWYLRQRRAHPRFLQYF